MKKHKKLEQEVMNHEPVVNKLLERGLEQHSNAPNDVVKQKLKEFKESWEGLKGACAAKSKKLDLSLKSQQFFFDASEIESWMLEKEDALTSNHYGKDIHSAVKLLTKHKTLELEMDSYNGLVQEMKHMANAMVSSGHPDRQLISAKIGAVEDHMGLLRRLGNDRREKLIQSVHTLEYFAEADEFLKYVDEVFGREVGCNEYGQDYEHLLLLQARFKDVELKVEGVNDRYCFTFLYLDFLNLIVTTSCQCCVHTSTILIEITYHSGTSRWRRWARGSSLVAGEGLLELPPRGRIPMMGQVTGPSCRRTRS